MAAAIKSFHISQIAREKHGPINMFKKNVIKFRIPVTLCNVFA